MIWQDIAILAAQGVMLAALVPTLRDRTKWPHRTTAGVTSAALAVMAVTLYSLGLFASTTIVVGLTAAWAWMAWPRGDLA